MDNTKLILKSLQVDKKRIQDKKKEKWYYTTKEAFDLLKINEKIKEYKRKIDR